MAEIIHNMGQTTYNDIADALLSDLNSADVQAEEKVRVLPRPILVEFVERVRLYGLGDSPIVSQSSLECLSSVCRLTDSLENMDAECPTSHL